MRDDVWMPHELAFVLDIYLKHGDLNRRAPEVLEASEVLRTLALAKEGRPESFRSPSSVASKLANFRSLDPAFAGGRPNGGRNDAMVWEKLAGRPEMVGSVAAAMGERAGSLG